MTNPPTDVRKGLPSGSSALEDSLCPGRHRMQGKGAPPPEPESGGNGGVSDYDSEDAAAGKRIHTLYAGQPCPDASEDEKNRAAAGREVDQLMYGKWMEFFDCEDLATVVEMREQRWWLHNDDGSPRYSGQTDVVWVRGNVGGQADILIGDLKGLWGDHDPARINMQLRRYIALLASSMDKDSRLPYSGLRSAMAYLNQPARTMNPVPAMYDIDDVQTAVMEMFMELEAMEDENAPRVPGPIQCHLCRGKLICPEYHGAIVKQTGVAVLTATKDGVQSWVQALTGEKLAELLPWTKTLSDMEELAKKEAKRRLTQDPDSVPGYYLKPNPSKHPVTNVAELYHRMNRLWRVEGKTFVAACGITKKNVIELMRGATKLKGIELDVEVQRILDGVTTPNPVSPSVERKEP